MLLGHPGRASGLARFLDYAKAKPNVWICKREDIARNVAELKAKHGITPGLAVVLVLGVNAVVNAIERRALREPRVRLL